MAYVKSKIVFANVSEAEAWDRYYAALASISMETDAKLEELACDADVMLLERRGRCLETALEQAKAAP